MVKWRKTSSQEVVVARSRPDFIDAEFEPVHAEGKLTLLERAFLALLTLPGDTVERVCGWIGVALVLAGIFAVRLWLMPWVDSLTLDQIVGGLAVSYVISCAVLGVLGGVAIYIAAICQKGFVLGGSLGLIPAWVGGWIIALGWPLILLVGLVWRGPWGDSVVGEWAVDQFERR